MRNQWRIIQAHPLELLGIPILCSLLAFFFLKPVVWIWLVAEHLLLILQRSRRCESEGQERTRAGRLFAYELVFNLKNGFNLQDSYFVATLALTDVATPPPLNQLAQSEGLIQELELDIYYPVLKRIFAMDGFARLRPTELELALEMLTNELNESQELRDRYQNRKRDFISLKLAAYITVTLVGLLAPPALKAVRGNYGVQIVLLIIFVIFEALDLLVGRRFGHLWID